MLGAKRGGDHLPSNQLAVPLGQGFEQDRVAEHGRNGTMGAHEGSNVANVPKIKTIGACLGQPCMARPVSAPNRSSKTRAMTMVARRRSASKMFSSARLAFASNSVRGPAPYSTT